MQAFVYNPEQLVGAARTAAVRSFGSAGTSTTRMAKQFPALSGYGIAQVPWILTSSSGTLQRFGYARPANVQFGTAVQSREKRPPAPCYEHRLCRAGAWSRQPLSWVHLRG